MGQRWSLLDDSRQAGGRWDEPGDSDAHWSAVRSAPPASPSPRCADRPQPPDRKARAATGGGRRRGPGAARVPPSLEPPRDDRVGAPGLGCPGGAWRNARMPADPRRSTGVSGAGAVQDSSWGRSEVKATRVDARRAGLTPLGPQVPRAQRAGSGAVRPVGATEGVSAPDSLTAICGVEDAEVGVHVLVRGIDRLDEA